MSSSLDVVVAVDVSVLLESMTQFLISAVWSKNNELVLHMQGSSEGKKRKRRGLAQATLCDGPQMQVIYVVHRDENASAHCLWYGRGHCTFQ